MTFKSTWPRAALLTASCLLGLTAAMPSAATKWDARYYNPKPARDDVELPMPCDGAMVFRKVPVPVAGPLDDYPIQIGQEGDEWGYIEQSRPAFIAGSFTESAKQHARYYLVSKYELTELQYQALTRETCPDASNKLRVPVTKISWFDAMRAGDIYNIWLRKNAATALPMEDGVAGFVRMPTEVEWEFAARGGMNVDKAQFVDTRYPMTGDLIKYEYFAGAQSANGKLQLAGLLEPNPLGLHDMLGNVEEMMVEPFRLNKLDRQHGQAGGYVVRGASYLTRQEEVRTSARREENFYSDAGALLKPTVGVRYVVVAPTLTSRERVLAIEKSWKGLGQGAVSADSTKAGTGAVQQLKTLASSVDDKKLKEQLTILESKLRASNQEQEEARDQAIRASLNLGSFLCTKLKDDGAFLTLIRDAYKTNCESANPDATCGMRKQRLTEQENRVEKLTQYYASSLVDAAGLYGQANLLRQYPVMDQTFEQNAQLRGMRPYLKTYWSHQQAYLKNKKLDLRGWLSSCVTTQNP